MWPRHMRWWRRWQLVIPIVWASGYEPGEGAALGAAPELEIVLGGLSETLWRKLSGISIQLLVKF